jgi:hypothetical protein
MANRNPLDIKFLRCRPSGLSPFILSCIWHFERIYLFAAKIKIHFSPPTAAPLDAKSDIHWMGTALATLKKTF